MLKLARFISVHVSSPFLIVNLQCKLLAVFQLWRPCYFVRRFESCFGFVAVWCWALFGQGNPSETHEYHIWRKWEDKSVGREEGAIFFSYPGSFSFCIPAPPFSSRKDCQKTKRDRIGVKKDYSLKLEQKPASRALLLQRPSTICQENFNQRSLPCVCVSFSLSVSASLSISLS